MEQIDAEYRVLSECPKLELFIDYFLKDDVVYATAKVMDESISSKKPIWGIDISIYAYKKMSFDEIVFASLNPKKKLNRRDQRKIVSKIRSDIYKRLEAEVLAE